MSLSRVRPRCSVLSLPVSIAGYLSRWLTFELEIHACTRRLADEAVSCKSVYIRPVHPGLGNGKSRSAADAYACASAPQAVQWHCSWKGKAMGG
jgi:hypothetical protein